MTSPVTNLTSRPPIFNAFRVTNVRLRLPSVTMGIRTMPWSEWIELDESFSFHQRIRNFRVRKCGETVLRVLPPREDDSVEVAGGAEAPPTVPVSILCFAPAGVIFRAINWRDTTSVGWTDANQDNRGRGDRGQVRFGSTRIYERRRNGRGGIKDSEWSDAR